MGVNYQGIMIVGSRNSDFCIGNLVSSRGYKARIHRGEKTWEGSDYKGTYVPSVGKCDLVLNC